MRLDLGIKKQQVDTPRYIWALWSFYDFLSWFWTSLLPLNCWRSLEEYKMQLIRLLCHPIVHPIQMHAQQDRRHIHISMDDHMHISVSGYNGIWRFHCHGHDASEEQWWWCITYFVWRTRRYLLAKRRRVIKSHKNHWKSLEIEISPYQPPRNSQWLLRFYDFNTLVRQLFPIDVGFLQKSVQF